MNYEFEFVHYGEAPVGEYLSFFSFSFCLVWKDMNGGED